MLARPDHQQVVPDQAPDQAPLAGARWSYNLLDGRVRRWPPVTPRFAGQAAGMAGLSQSAAAAAGRSQASGKKFNLNFGVIFFLRLSPNLTEVCLFL